MTATTVNPVWASFCARKIEDWIEWLRNIQIDSYLELSERFIALNPHYVPSDTDLSSSSGQTFERLMIDEDFIGSLSDQGLLVWANSGVADFVLASGCLLPRLGGDPPGHSLLRQASGLVRTGLRLPAGGADRRSP